MTESSATVLLQLTQQVARLIDRIDILEGRVGRPQRLREWYSTEDVAELTGKDQYTVQGWCRASRTECQKDEFSGRWRIHSAEYERLAAGGGLLPVGSAA